MSVCLVAGGAGFIGSHLCENLLNNSYRVICVDNFLTGNKTNVAPFLSQPKFLLINADISKPLPEVLTEEKLDYIFHLASPASPNALSPLSYINLPLETMDANSLGTRRLLRLARKHQAKFLYASTSEVYGDPKVHPQPESYWGYVNSVGPRSCYDEAKRFGEALTMVYIRRFKLNARIVRIFNTYGPRMDVKDGRAIANFIVQALKNEPLTVYGKGKQTRSFCYIDDLVSGLKKAMFTEAAKNQIINLGNPEEFTVLELAKKIKRVTGSASPLKVEARALPEDDPEKRRPDISRAKKLLGWQPKVKFNQGIKKTVAYFAETLAHEPK
jgi:nucleoside-diphosphate-sugar epimerase